MKQLEKYNVVLWDFDGVILDSMPVRELGFEKTLSRFPQKEIAELLNFHRRNGGLSRYVKFRHFFSKIRKEKVSDDQILAYAEQFSGIMMEMLIDKSLLIKDSVSYIKKNHDNYKFHIVSGSDGVELNKICKGLELTDYFVSISGSPTPKIELVSNVLKSFNYEKNKVCLIGDSVNDKEAAEINKIDFFGYNNIELRNQCCNYIDIFPT